MVPHRVVGFSTFALLYSFEEKMPYKSCLKVVCHDNITNKILNNTLKYNKAPKRLFSQLTGFTNKRIKINYN